MQVLEEVLAIVEQNPHSLDSLSLFALMSTLSIEKSGCLYKCVKLRDMSEKARQVAYNLMEEMVSQNNSGEEWQQCLREIEKAMRG